MSESRDELLDRLYDVGSMPDGALSCRAMDDLLRDVSALDDIELNYETRIRAASVYTQGGEREKAFVAFSWCLAARDAGQVDGEFDHNLHWYFKFMVTAMVAYPQFTLEQLNTLLDDMERRYRVAGYTLGSLYQHRMIAAEHIGDSEQADEFYRRWNAEPRGEMSDCRGCEPTHRVQFLNSRGRYNEAVDQGRPVLTGRVGCIEQPQRILTSLLQTYVATGQFEQAAQAHRDAYRRVQHNKAYLSCVADNLTYLTQVGELGRAFDIAQRHLRWLESPPTPEDAMLFRAAASRAFKLSAATKSDLTVHTPASDDSLGGIRPAGQVAAELRDQALVVARQFDERNGTESVSGRVRAILAVEPLVTASTSVVDAPTKARGLFRRKAKPITDDLPTDPTALAELAEAYSDAGRADDERRAWIRFDEVEPQPQGLLRALRLDARGFEDPENPAAMLHWWTLAQDEFTKAGDERRALAVSGRLAMLQADGGDVEGGLIAARAALTRLEAIGSKAEQARAHIKLANVLATADRIDESVAEFARARALGVEANRSDVVGHVDTRMIAYWQDKGEDGRSQCLATADRAVSLWRSIGATTSLHWALLVAGQAYASYGDYKNADRLLSEAVVTSDVQLRGNVYDARGRVAVALGRPEQAKSYFAAAMAALVDAPVRRGEVAMALATLCMEQGDATGAANAADEAILALESRDVPDSLAFARYVAAGAYERLDQKAEAAAALEAVAEHDRQSGNVERLAHIEAFRSRLLSELDRDREAADASFAAADAFKQLGQSLDQADALRRAAAYLLWGGGEDRAPDVIAEAEQIATAIRPRDTDVELVIYNIHLDAAKIMLWHDRFDEATTHAKEASAGFRLLGEFDGSAAADALRARILWTQDLDAEALAVIDSTLNYLPADAKDSRKQLTTLREHILNPDDDDDDEDVDY